MGPPLCYRKSFSYDRREKGNLSPLPPKQNKNLNPSLIPFFPPFSVSPLSCLQLSWQLEEGAEKCIPVSTFNCLAPAPFFLFLKAETDVVYWTKKGKSPLGDMWLI